MDQQIRIIGFTKKTAIQRIRVSEWFSVTADLNGLGAIYLDAWNRRKNDSQISADVVEGLSLDYFLNLQPEPMPEAQFNEFYSARYTDANLQRVCLTLLQLEVRVRLVLVVKSDLCSFVVAANRPCEEVLAQHFEGVRKISRHRFNNVRHRLVDARTLTRLSLPQLLGVGEAAPLAFEVRADPVQGIELGAILSPLTRKPIGKASIPLDALTRALFIAGTIGSGKTTTATSVTNQALSNGVPVLIFDIKQEHRTQAKLNGARVLGFSERNLFTMNLLKPSGPPSQWIKEFASIFAEIISRGVPAEGSKDVIISELDELFRERRIFEGGTDYPHVGDLLERLLLRTRGDSSRESNWVASAVRVLKSLMVGTTKQAFCVREGLSLGEFFHGCTVIELERIGDRSAVGLVVSVVLRKIYNHLLESQDRNRLKLVVVLEEAQNVLARDAEASSFLASMCREGRALGMGFVFVTQMPSEFSTNAIANSNAIISHKLVLPADKRVMADILGLTAAQARVLEELPVGEAVARTTSTYLIRVPDLPRPPVHDDELHAETRTREEVSTDFAQRTDVSRRWERLTRQEREAFRIVAEGQAVMPSRVAELLRCKNTVASDVLGSLLRTGLVNYLSARTGKRGHPPSIYFLTAYGEEAYRQLALNYADVKQEKSDKHSEVVAKVVVALGLKPKHPSAPFDILYAEGERERAIEVETGSNKSVQIAKNLRKSVELQDEAVFVATDERTYNRVLQVSARETFDTRRRIRLKLAVMEALPHWDAFEIEPVPITT